MSESNRVARQQSRFFNLMESHTRSLELYEGALDSAGTTTEKYGIYAESTQAKIDELKATVEGLWLALIDSGAINTTIESFTRLIEVLTSLIDKFGAFGIIVPAFIGLLVKAKVQTALFGDEAKGLGVTLLELLGKSKGVAKGLLEVASGAETASLAISASKLAMGGLIAVMGAAVIASIKYANAHEKAKEAMVENADATRELVSEVDHLDDLIGKYQELSSVEDASEEQKQKLLDVQRELAELYPTLATGIDDEGNMLADNLEITEKLANEKRELLLTQLEADKALADSTLPQMKKELEEVTRAIEMQQESLKNSEDNVNPDEVAKALQKSVERYKELTEEIAWAEQVISYYNDETERQVENERWRQAEMLATQAQTASSIDELQHLEEQLISLGFSSEEASQMMAGGFEEVREAAFIASEAGYEYIMALDSVSQAEKESTSIVIIEQQNKTRQVIAETKKRIQAMQAELNAQNALYGMKRRIETMTALPGSIQDKYGDKVAKMWETESKNAKLQQQIDSEFLALRDAQATEKRLDEMLNHVSGLSPGGAGRTPSGNIERRPGKGGSKKKPKSKKPKKKKEEYKAEADRYAAINRELERNNYLLDINNTKQSLAEDKMGDKIELMLMEIQLNKERQKTLNRLNNERRKERDELEKKLSAQGFKFAGQGDERHITNLDAIEGKSKEVEELFDRYNKIPSEIHSASSEWWKLKSTIESSMKEIEKMAEDIGKELDDIKKRAEEIKEERAFEVFKMDLKESMMHLTPFKNELDLLADKFSILGDSNSDLKLDLLTEQFKKSKEYGQMLRSEFDRLSQKTTSNSNETNELISTLSDLQGQIKENTSNIIEYQKAIDNIRIDELANDFKELTDQVEKELKLINYNMSILEGGLLSGTDIHLDSNFILPRIPENLVDKQIKENLKMIENQEEFENIINELQWVSHEQQKEEQQRHYEETMQELTEHYDELTQKLSSFISKSEDLNRLHQDTVGQITDKGLSEVERAHIETWKNIVESIQGQVAAVNSALSGMATPSSGGSSGGGGGGSKRDRSGYEANREQRQKEADYYSKNKEAIDKISDAHGSDISESIDRHQKGDYDKEKVRKYKSGTSGHDGKRKALVGEEGVELGILPSGRTILLGKQGPELVDLPKGTEVVTHDETKDILKYTGDIDNEKVAKYKDGTISGVEKKLVESGLYVTTVEYQGNKYIVHENGRVYKGDGRGGFNFLSMVDSVDEWPSGMYKQVNDAYARKFPGFKNRYFDGTKLGSKQFGRNPLVSQMKGAYYMGGYDKDLPSDYSQYRSEREGTMSSIQEEQQYILDNFEILDTDVLNRLRIEVLDKIDEQLAKDVYMQQRMMIDILQQQEANVREYIDDIESEYLEAIEDGNVTKAQRLSEQYYEATDVYMSLNDQIKNAIKDRYEYEFGLIEKKIKKEREVQSFLDKELKKQQLSGSRSYANELLIYDAMLQKEEEIYSINQSSLNEILKQRDAIEAGSYEWNILNDQAIQLQHSLEDSNIEMMQLKDTIMDANFKHLLRELEEIERQRSDLEYQLEMTKLINPKDYDSISGFNRDIVDNLKTQREELRGAIGELEKQHSTLGRNTQQWNKLNDQINDAKVQLQNTNIELAEMSKHAYLESLYYNRRKIEADLRGIDEDSLDNIENMIGGTEKELEAQKILNYAKEYELELTAEQYDVLTSEEPVRRKSMALIQKELELEQLLTKERHLRNQKTKQQLEKQDDGSWEYTYTFDQDAILENEEAILDKRLELERLTVDDANEIIDEFFDNAENRIYKTKKEFENALSEIGVKVNSPQGRQMIDDYWFYFSSMSEITIEESLTNAIDTTEEATSYIIDAMNREIERFGLAGSKQGAAYKDALVNALEDAREEALRIVSAMVKDMENNTFGINTTIHGNSEDIARFNTGGYTGSFKGGKLAILDEKELVLNQADTLNILKAVETVRDINLPKISQTDNSMGNIVIKEITYPNVTSADEVIKTIQNLPNDARQRVK